MTIYQMRSKINFPLMVLSFTIVAETFYSNYGSYPDWVIASLAAFSNGIVASAFSAAERLSKATRRPGALFLILCRAAVSFKSNLATSKSWKNYGSFTKGLSLLRTAWAAGVMRAI